MDLPGSGRVTKSIHNLYNALKIGYPKEQEIETFIVVCYLRGFGVNEYLFADKVGV